MQKIICFSGQIANGKTLSASYLYDVLCNKVGLWHKASFADAVREVFCSSFGENLDFIKEWKRNENPPPGYLKNIRSSLQWIGDGFRQIRSDVWVNKLFNTYDPVWNTHLIIDDGRYVSEIEAVKERGGINVAIYRPGFENEIDHSSEAELKEEIRKLVKRETGPVEDSIFDFFLRNDGDIDELYKKINNILIPFIEEWYKSDVLW